MGAEEAKWGVSQGSPEPDSSLEGQQPCGGTVNPAEQEKPHSEVRRA